MVERGIEKLQLTSNDGIVLHFKEITISTPLICNLHHGIILEEQTFIVEIIFFYLYPLIIRQLKAKNFFMDPLVRYQ